MDAKPGRKGASSLNNETSAAAREGRLASSVRSAATSTAVWACMGLVGMLVQNEMLFYFNSKAQYGAFCPDLTDLSCDPRDASLIWPPTQQSTPIDAIRALCVTLTSIMALASTVKLHGAMLDHERSRNLVPAKTTLLRSHLALPLLLECAMLACHPFPTLEAVLQDTTLGPAIYLFLSQVMWLRLLLVGRAAVLHSSLTSSNGRFISALTNVEFSHSFIVKTGGSASH